MTFTFDNTTPAASEGLATSQPKILQNFQSTQSILAVDHVTFNNATGGEHTKVTYVQPITPGAPTNPSSIGYANAGVANPGVPQLYWRNANSIFPISAIKAFAVFTPTSGAITPNNAFNILSISGAGVDYTINFTVGAISTDDVIVFVSLLNTSSIPTYNFSGGVLTIRSTTSAKISFVILQI